jgi:hypothetical protein
LFLFFFFVIFANVRKVFCVEHPSIFRIPHPPYFCQSSPPLLRGLKIQSFLFVLVLIAFSRQNAKLWSEMAHSAIIGQKLAESTCLPCKTQVFICKLHLCFARQTLPNSKTQQKKTIPCFP